MATPTSRETFKEYCLRTLGKPVVDINVDDQQVEDRIDDALQYYRDYHFDGTCLLYTSPSPRDRQKSRMPSSA